MVYGKLVPLCVERSCRAALKFKFFECPVVVVACCGFAHADSIFQAASVIFQRLFFLFFHFFKNLHTILTIPKENLETRILLWQCQKQRGERNRCLCVKVREKPSLFCGKGNFMKKTVLTLGVSALVAVAVFAQDFNSSSALGELSTNANAEASANQETVSENADDKTLSAQEISKSIEEVDGIKVFAEVLKNSSDKIQEVASDSGVTVLAPIDAIADTGKIAQNISDYIVPEKLTKENLESKTSVQTLSGKTLPVEVKDSAVLINNVEVAGLADSADDKVAVLRLANNFSESTSVALAE